MKYNEIYMHMYMHVYVNILYVRIFYMTVPNIFPLA